MFILLLSMRLLCNSQMFSRRPCLVYMFVLIFLLFLLLLFFFSECGQVKNITEIKQSQSGEAFSPQTVMVQYRTNGGSYISLFSMNFSDRCLCEVLEKKLLYFLGYKEMIILTYSGCSAIAKCSVEDCGYAGWHMFVLGWFIFSWIWSG